MSPEFINLALRFRESWNETLALFTDRVPERSIVKKDELLAVLRDLKEIETSEYDQIYFTCINYMVSALFLGVQGFHQAMKGIDNGPIIRGINLNVEQFLQLSETLDKTRPSVQLMRRALSEWRNHDNIRELSQTIDAINKIAFPVILSAETHRYAYLRRGMEDTIEPKETSEREESIVMSIRFYMDSELWANPQIIKPEHQYSITGTIKINKWPEGYDQLHLTHVSTTNDTWMILSFPVIPCTSDLEFTIAGSIVLKYAQSLLDVPHAIRLVARFTGNSKEPVYPKIVGYDQLILRVVDSKNFDYPTGYDKLNEKVLDIFQKTKTELPDVPDHELNNFLVLLSSILNYQGYCFQHGEYKSQDDIREDNFRDKLIRYLSANPRLSSTIIKEASIGGGRVEINYNGIIAELKIEKQITDRSKLIEKYIQQPLAYASAVSSQLSILCILDLTEKKYASAIAAKNLFFIAPPVHGFETEQSSSRIAVVFIDGNTKNPSSY